MKSTQNKKKAIPLFTKEDANRKPSILFIQLGLVLALLLTYIVIESKTLVDNSTSVYIPPTYEPDGMTPPDTTPEEPKPKKVQSVVTPEPILDDPEILKNDSNEIETVIDVKKNNPDSPVDLIDYPIEIKIPEDIIEDVPFYDIQDAPLFPGCRGTKEELKQCFSDSVKKLVERKFNGDLAQEVGLTPGKIRIFAQFTVDKKGAITDVLVKAPHKRLEKETRRVVDLLPQMTPGKQRGRPVGVKFLLPITFMVE